MVRSEIQTCLRMSDAVKSIKTKIYKGYKINKSELMRRAGATFLEHLNETPEKHGKCLFV